MLMDCDDDDAAVVLLSLSLCQNQTDFLKCTIYTTWMVKKCSLAILLRYIMKCVALWNV